MKIPASLSYSVRRLGLFAATLLFLVVVLPGASFLLVLMIATVVSGFMSYFLLAGPRKEMARSVESRMQGLGQRIDSGAKKEDAALDAAEAEARRKVQHGPGSSSKSHESGEDPTRRP